MKKNKHGGYDVTGKDVERMFNEVLFNKGMEIKGTHVSALEKGQMKDYAELMKAYTDNKKAKREAWINLGAIGLQAAAIGIETGVHIGDMNQFMFLSAETNGYRGANEVLQSGRGFNIRKNSSFKMIK